MTRRQRWHLRLQAWGWGLAADIAAGIGDAQLDQMAALRWHFTAFAHRVRSSTASGRLMADALARLAVFMAALDEGPLRLRAPADYSCVAAAGARWPHRA